MAREGLRMYDNEKVNRFLCVLLLPTMFAQSVKISDGCTGVIREAADATKMHGTAFYAGIPGRIITAAHVVPDGRYTYEGVGQTLKPAERVVELKLAYQLADYDLAVFDPIQMCQGCVTCKDPFVFGNPKKIRPGDKLIYLGWSPGQDAVQANVAEVQATGSALNGRATIEFFEFYGVGVPGYSGGPVLATDGTIVGVMREAWVRQGVKGGMALLMNRAFSIEPVAARENASKRFPKPGPQSK